jgi:hypothetical protein
MRNWINTIFLTRTEHNKMATRKRGEGIKSVIQKLEDSINAGDYYHAEQMYKTLYYR